MKRSLALLSACLSPCFFLDARANDSLLWDLAIHDIPAGLQSGRIERVNGSITLRDGAAFAVPSEAFPDHRNFTVQVTLSLEELVQDGVCMVMKKESGDTDDGFSLSFNYKDEPYHARQISSVVNRILMTGSGLGGRNAPELGRSYTFTVAVRDGLATFYLDEVPIKSCFMELIPNGESMWIGRNGNPKAKALPVTIQGVKVYGPGFNYVSKREERGAFPRGAVAGKGWALDVPRIDHPEWPKILIYGDSISMGYRQSFIPEMLERKAYVFHCVHFVGGEVPEAALTEMAGRYPFDVVVFNNGLHSLGWTPDKVPDEMVLDRMRRLARCFKAGAPQARLFYLMTTPHTASRPAPDQPVAGMGDKNGIVIRLNTLSAQVMKEEGIEIIDAYSLLASRLDLAAGDRFHWRGPAYELLTREIIDRISSPPGAAR